MTHTRTIGPITVDHLNTGLPCNHCHHGLGQVYEIRAAFTFWLCHSCFEELLQKIVAARLRAQA